MMIWMHYSKNTIQYTLFLKIYKVCKFGINDIKGEIQDDKEIKTENKTETEKLINLLSVSQKSLKPDEEVINKQNHNYDRL